MIDARIADAAQCVESTFQKIHIERMTDLPLNNPALSVKALGFTIFKGEIIGVLVTPWCMNLILLPESVCVDVPGTTRTVTFPSGRYEFIWGEDSKIGHYLMCSLFSPVFEFEDQEGAEATALAVMRELMNDDNRDLDSTRAGEICQIWGVETSPQVHAAEPGEKSPDQRPISRRALLTGRLARGSG